MLLDEDKIKNLEDNAPFNFEDAMYALRAGMKVKRQDWSGYIKLNKQMSVTGFVPHFIDEKGEKYDLITEEILAEDWYLL